MCRIAWLNFSAEVSQTRRAEIVTLVAKNSWDLGNKDGVGVVTFDGDDGEHSLMARSLTLVGLVLPKVIRSNALIHARHATCPVTLSNTHPISGAGCYLVHNGIASLQGGKKRQKKIRKLLHTSNDSEYILKAYLTNDRDLHTALSKDVGGWVNVLLWDERQRKLSVFADQTDFCMFRQHGVFTLAQELRQVVGLYTSGLGEPLEYGKLEADRVYTVALKGAKTDVVKAVKKSLINAPTLTLLGFGAADDSSTLPLQGFEAAAYRSYSYTGGTQDTAGSVYRRHPEYWDRSTDPKDPKMSGDPRPLATSEKPDYHYDNFGVSWVRGPNGQFVREDQYERLFRDEKKAIAVLENAAPTKASIRSANQVAHSLNYSLTNEEMDRIEEAMYADSHEEADLSKLSPRTGYGSTFEDFDEPKGDVLDEPPYFDGAVNAKVEKQVPAAEHTSV